MEFGDSLTIGARKFLLIDLHGKRIFGRQEHGEEVLVLDTGAHSRQALLFFDTTETDSFEGAIHLVYGISFGGICRHRVPKSRLPDDPRRDIPSAVCNLNSQREPVVLGVKLHNFLGIDTLSGKFQGNPVALTASYKAGLRE